MKPLTDMQLESIVSKARAIINLHSFGALKLSIQMAGDMIIIQAAPGLTANSYTEVPTFHTDWKEHRDMELSFALQYIGTLAGDHFVGLLMSLESLDANPFDLTQDTIGALPVIDGMQTERGEAIYWSPADHQDNGPSWGIRLAPCWLEYIESMDLSGLDEDKLP